MLKLFQEWWEGGYRKMMEGMNLATRYYKNFCKCPMYPQHNNNMIIKKFLSPDVIKLYC
jgi:hypothetical protein